MKDTCIDSFSTMIALFVVHQHQALHCLVLVLYNTVKHRQTSVTCLVQDESDEHLTMIVAMEGKELEKALFAAKTTSL